MFESTASPAVAAQPTAGERWYHSGLSTAMVCFTCAGRSIASATGLRCFYYVLHMLLLRGVGIAHASSLRL